MTYLSYLYITLHTRKDGPAVRFTKLCLKHVFTYTILQLKFSSTKAKLIENEPFITILQTDKNL